MIGSGANGPLLYLRNSAESAYYPSSMAERIILTVEKLASGGDGIAFFEGQAVFIPFSIPGEKIACTILQRSRDYSRAMLEEIMEPSPHRTAPPCPVFGRCGGCSLQHIEYEKQLEYKAATVADSLRRIAKIEAVEPEIHSGAPYGYRNRVQLHFTEDHGLGFMEAESAASVRAPGCPIAAPCIDAWLKRQNRKSRPDKELKARIGERDRFVVFGQDERLYVEGIDAKAVAIVAGKKYIFPVRHFFQSNLAMAGALVEDAVAELSGERAVDLYAGAGLFAARLAERFRSVTLVESDAVSLEAARANLPAGSGKFVPTDVEAWTDGAAAGAAQGAPRIDCVLADPPRAGLSPATRAWLKSADIGTFVYVSCDPVTMARDIGELARSGWTLESLALYDFYPQTGHIESLARLSPPGRQAQGG